jgi:hypothetical protein
MIRRAPVPEVDDAVDECYGTRWGVLLKLLVPALAVVIGLATAMMRGVLATSFVAEGGTLQLTTSGLKGDGVAILLQKVPKGIGTKNSYDARVGIAHGRINGLCITQRVSILGVDFTLKVTGGDNDPSTYELSANGVFMDARSADGKIYAYGHTEVNKNAASVVAGDSGMQLGGSNQRFGIQAEQAKLTEVQAIVHDIQIPGSLEASPLHISFEQGDASCPAPAAPTD